VHPTRGGLGLSQQVQLRQNLPVPEEGRRKEKYPAPGRRRRSSLSSGPRKLNSSTAPNVHVSDGRSVI